MQTPPFLLGQQWVSTGLLGVRGQDEAELRVVAPWETCEQSLLLLGPELILLRHAGQL